MLNYILEYKVNIFSVVLVALTVLGLVKGQPVINDITTDFESPPSYVFLAKQDPGYDFSYPQSFAAKQQKSYPEVLPLKLELPPQQAFALATELASARFEVVSVDPVALKLEAIATTKFVHFKDDIVIKVRPNDSGSGGYLHMRSKSRLGLSDFGANSNRISTFFASFRAQAAKVK